MSRLIWDTVGDRHYETGVEQGVLFPQGESSAYGAGVAWNGLTGVTVTPSGAEPTPVYADNMKYLVMTSIEELGGTIEALMYPDEFAQCNGEAELETGVTIGQQDRKYFGLVFKTLIGNDVDGTSHGYKLHIIYGAKAKPSEQAHATVNDSPEAMTMSWEFSTTPVAVTGMKPTASVTIDSTKADATKLAALEVILFGKDGSAEGVTPVVAAVDPRLPLPDEIATLMEV